MVLLSQTIAIFAGTLASASAIRPQKQIWRKHFTLHQASTVSNISVGANVSSATFHGSVTTSPSNTGAQFVTQITVGDSALNVDFDTGSGVFWVFSTELPSNETVNHHIYDPRFSGQNAGNQFNVSYGDNSTAIGVVYKDTITIGNLTPVPQLVGAAASISSGLFEEPNDGVLGLGFSELNAVQPPVPTFLDSIKPYLDEALFAVSLKDEAPGSFDFGFIDSQKFTGQITYTDVDNSNGKWGFSTQGYSIGPNTTTRPSSIIGIADTGTTLLYLPVEIVQEYYAPIHGAHYDSGSGYYLIPCSATLPNFNVMINGYTAVVPGSLIMRLPFTKGSSYCLGGIQKDDGNGSIFGDVFLKSQYVVFDFGTPKIGFAPQA
jgi:aspergillopepsin I